MNSDTVSLHEAARLGAKALRARARELAGFARRYRQGRTDHDTTRAYRQYTTLHEAARLLDLWASQRPPEPMLDEAIANRKSKIGD